MHIISLELVEHGMDTLSPGCDLGSPSQGLSLYYPPAAHRRTIDAHCEVS